MYLLKKLFSLMNNGSYIYLVPQCLQVGKLVTFRYIGVSTPFSVHQRQSTSCSFPLPTYDAGRPP